MANRCRRVSNGSSGSSKVYTARKLGGASYGTVHPQETLQTSKSVSEASVRREARADRSIMMNPVASWLNLFPSHCVHTLVTYALNPLHASTIPARS